MTEATLNALRSPYSHLLHASVALRAVPGEFDLGGVAGGGRSAAAVCRAAGQRIEQRLAALGGVLAGAEQRVLALAQVAQLPPCRTALALAQFLLGRLRMGWNESGLWNPRPCSVQMLPRWSAGG